MGELEAVARMLRDAGDTCFVLRAICHAVSQPTAIIALATHSHPAHTQYPPLTPTLHRPHRSPDRRRVPTLQPRLAHVSRARPVTPQHRDASKRRTAARHVRAPSLHRPCGEVRGDPVPRSCVRDGRDGRDGHGVTTDGVRCHIGLSGPVVGVIGGPRSRRSEVDGCVWAWFGFEDWAGVLGWACVWRGEVDGCTRS